MSVTFRLDGQTVDYHGRTDLSLTDILREDFGETATKSGCQIGRCGACMVLMNGRPVNSCLLMAWQLDRAEIVTGAGLSDLPLASTIREALVAENAFQCGYCAPGFVISLVGLFSQNPGADEAEIRAALEGNPCRCTGYHSILRGALSAAAALRDAHRSGDL